MGLSEIPQKDAEKFLNCIKLTIPQNYLQSYKCHANTENSDVDLLLGCAEKLLEIVLGDCLKLNQVEDGNKTSNVTKLEPKDDEVVTDESPAKKLKLDCDVKTKSCSSWKLWKLVWPKRKQIAVELEQGEMDTIAWEAAITEKVVQSDITLPDPEAVFKTNLLVKPSYSNTVIVGFEKIQSRKKSFEALVVASFIFHRYSFKIIKREDAR